MKPRFTFQYLYNLLILNTFHQAQGMKTNPAVSCLLMINLYWDHVSIVPYSLLNDGRVHVSEAAQITHSYLQQLTTENGVYPIWKESQRMHCCFHSYLCPFLHTIKSPEIAVNLAHFHLCVQLYLLLEVNAQALGNAHKIFGF